MWTMTRSYRVLDTEDLGQRSCVRMTSPEQGPIRLWNAWMPRLRPDMAERRLIRHGRIRVLVTGHVPVTDGVALSFVDDID